MSRTIETLDYANCKRSRLAIAAAILGCAGTPIFLFAIAIWSIVVEGFEESSPAGFWLRCVWQTLWFGVVFTPVVLGIISIRQIKNSAGSLTGMGYALAGLMVPLLIMALCMLSVLSRR
jgi:hypothetical protein